MKRSIILGFTFCMIVISPGLLFAQTMGEKLQKMFDFELGSEMFWYQYEEPGVMENEGLFGGINGSIATWFSLFNAESTTDQDMLRLETAFAWGQVDYDSETTGSMDDIDDWLVEIRGLFGHQWQMKEGVLLTPYTGIAYRYFNDDSGGRTTTTNHAGYERESNYYYSPFGIDLVVDLDQKWSIGGNLEYDLFWFGQQKSHLGDAVAGLDTVENDQTKGYGYRVSLKVIYKSENFDFLFEPYYRYWDIEKSEESPVTYSGVAVGYGWEPQNNTQQIGMKSAILF